MRHFPLAVCPPENGDGVFVQAFDPAQQGHTSGCLLEGCGTTNDLIGSLAYGPSDTVEVAVGAPFQTPQHR